MSNATSSGDHDTTSSTSRNESAPFTPSSSDIGAGWWQENKKLIVGFVLILILVGGVGLYMVNRDEYPDLNTEALIQKGLLSYQGHDYSTAMDYFHEACKRESADGCYNVATLYNNGQGTSQDHTKAAQLFSKACDLGSLLGCNRLGESYISGLGVDKDPNKGWQVLHKACSLDDLDACDTADGIIHENPTLASYVAAESHAWQNSQGNLNPDSCRAYLKDFRYGPHASTCQAILKDDAETSYQHGKSAYAKGDIGEAEKDFKIACLEESGDGCSALGDKYFIQSQVAKDPQSFNPYAGGCGPESSTDCMQSMMFFAQAKPVHGLIAFGAARTLYNWGCDEGSGYGCLSLSGMYSQGTGVPQDQAKSSELIRRASILLEKSCNENRPDGCKALGSIYFSGKGVTQDYVKSAALFEQGCNGGNADACVALGHQYYAGKGVRQEFASAGQWFERGCKGGSPIGCAAIGDLLVNGQGIARDPDSAIPLYNVACQAGIPDACRMFENLTILRSQHPELAARPRADE